MKCTKGGNCSYCADKICKQEDAAMDKIQLTEEEAKEIYRAGRLVWQKNEEKVFINNLKVSGYIARPVWEEAEERYNRIFKSFDTVDNGVTRFEIFDFICKQHDAIIALKEKAGIK